jgi:hypothetical protein
MCDYWYCRSGFLIASTYLIARQVLLELPFNPECRGNEDVDWLMRAEATGLLRPAWVNEILVIYHSEHTGTRLSKDFKWQRFFEWFRHHQQYFSRESVPYYLGRICIPEAKRAPNALRNCTMLLSYAVSRGTMTPRSLAYLATVLATSRETRARLRQRIALLVTLSNGGRSRLGHVGKRSSKVVLDARS